MKGLSMMVIKQILDREIKAGLINWNKLEKKIHVLLSMVDNNFESIKEDTGEKIKIKTSDSFTFPVLNDGERICYKIFKPRFRQGLLWCGGIQIGGYDLKGQPFFPTPVRMF